MLDIRKQEEPEEDFLNSSERLILQESNKFLHYAEEDVYIGEEDEQDKINENPLQKEKENQPLVSHLYCKFLLSLYLFQYESYSYNYRQLG